MLNRIIRPDSKGRITLGSLAKGVSGYTVTETKDHMLILNPLVEIPACETWLFKNKQAIKSVEKGLEDAENGRVSARGSFSKYIDEDK